MFNQSRFVKNVAFITFCAVRRAAHQVQRTPGVARNLAADVRDAWRESALATTRASSDKPPF
jgi:hypothetical protein